MLVRERHLLLRGLDEVVDDLLVDRVCPALEEVVDLLPEPGDELCAGDPGLLLKFAKHRLLLALAAHAVPLHQVPVPGPVLQDEVLETRIPPDDDRPT